MKKSEDIGKSPAIVKLLDAAAERSFGRTRSQAFGPGGRCTTCGSSSIKDEDFRDELSRKEFKISGMCQKCQDEVFHEESLEDA